MKTFSWVSFILLLCTCPVFGQVTKAPLTENDFARFGKLHNESLSNDGKWACYSMSYESGLDTLYISQIDGQEKINIPRGRDARFIGGHFFCCLKDNTGFQIINLDSKVVWNATNIKRYEISSDFKHIILIVEATQKKFSIQIHNLDGSLLKEVFNVTSYSIDKETQKIAFCTQGETAKVQICELTGNIKFIDIISKQGFFENFVWHKAGSSIAFLYGENDNIKSVYFYSIFKEKLYCSPSLGIEYTISADYGEHLKISTDSKSVYFTTTNSSKNIREYGTAQVWNAADSFLYSRRKNLGEEIFWMKWIPESQYTYRISTEQLPHIIFTEDLRYAVCYNGKEYSPSPKAYPDRDCFLVNLENGHSTLLERQLSGYPNEIQVSPQGSLIAYKHKENWVIVDPDTSRCHTISTSINNSPLLFLAWTSDNKSLLFTDNQDIWQVDWKKKSLTRLTFGKEKGLFFRTANDSGVIDKNHILLKMRNDDFSYSGYALIENGVFRVLLSDQRKISEIQFDSSGKAFTFITEDFNQSPELESIANGHKKRIHQSNVFIKQYSWGKSQVAKYDINGQNLNGVLIYPFNFDPKLKYPMIVHIYESQNLQLHEFVNPTLHNSYGFNITLLASQGYFIFLPDIIYRIGEPGLSAAECVIAATSAICAKYPIDDSRIGIIGHSFGGYETNFIITQTDIFRCAVSGAGISNYVSSYLSEDKNFSNISYWRFESDQRRMGYPLFQNRIGYLMNSPVYHAENVETPLLQFIGERDTQVTPTQSFEFYFALRRLNKENILLVYPKEGHILVDKENQEDLTLKITDWFNYYLKDNDKLQWMCPK